MPIEKAQQTKAKYPIFLSVVLIVRNPGNLLEPVLKTALDLLDSLVSDHEIIIVDNASKDRTMLRLEALTKPDGLSNLQVYGLTEEVAQDTAAWVGLENALGDYVAVLDPLVDDICFLSNMLEKATTGSDVVFAGNTYKTKQKVFYSLANSVFQKLYEFFNGIHLAKDAPTYRLLNRKVINFILQHQQPAVTYRYLPATGGFAKVNISYSSAPQLLQPKRLIDSVERGMWLLTSTTHAPMRFVTTLSLFGAVANLLYSIYVVVIVLFKDDVVQGWASMSLQLSGMFFLISLVLLVLGEYILHMARLSNDGPSYHIGRELTSARITRKEKLNIEKHDLPIDSDTKT